MIVDHIMSEFLLDRYMVDLMFQYLMMIYQKKLKLFSLRSLAIGSLNNFRHGTPDRIIITIVDDVMMMVSFAVKF